MSNHFHPLLRPEPGVAIGCVMQSLLVSHTWRYHRRHRGCGHVWQGRFKSPPVQDDGHLWAVLRYIEANTLRAGIVADPADYRWSSYPARQAGRPEPLVVDPPGWSDLGDSPGARAQAWLGKVLAALSEDEVAAIGRSLARGRPYGEPAWSDGQAATLGLGPADRLRGRPRKAEK